MDSNAIAVFCVDQNDVNVAFNHWVHVVGYTLVSKTQVSSNAGHYAMDAAGNYGIAACTPYGQYKFVLVFQGN